MKNKYKIKLASFIKACEVAKILRISKQSMVARQYISLVDAVKVASELKTSIENIIEVE